MNFEGLMIAPTGVEVAANYPNSVDLTVVADPEGHSRIALKLDKVAGAGHIEIQGAYGLGTGDPVRDDDAGPARVLARQDRQGPNLLDAIAWGNLGSIH